MRIVVVGFVLGGVLCLSVACGGDAPAETTTVATAVLDIPSDNRIRIPKIGVDAPLTLKVVASNGQLPRTDGPDDVAIYDLSPFPGLGGMPGRGNNIFSGDPDSGTRSCSNGTVPPPCKAVFFDLRRLARGDEIQVFWERQAFIYRVVANCWVERTGQEVDVLYATTEKEIATLITAGGPFVRGSYTYDLYVRAERIPGSISPDCPAGSPTPPPTPAPTPRP
jgi:hypothetical protein